MVGLSQKKSEESIPELVEFLSEEIGNYLIINNK